MAENETRNAGLVIAEDVVAKIASTAARDINGVAGLALPKGRAGAGRDLSRAVRIQRDGQSTFIDLYLTVKVGARIPDVADAVQQSVKDAVQNMTGCAVTQVNVHIEDLDMTKRMEVKA